MSRKIATEIPRLSLTPSEAAAALGVGEEFFRTEIRPELRIVRRGRKALIPVAELRRWVEENAAPVLEER